MTDWALYVEVTVARRTYFVIFADTITASAAENLTTAPAKTIFKINHTLTARTMKNIFVILKDIALQLLWMVGIKVGRSFIEKGATKGAGGI